MIRVYLSNRTYFTLALPVETTANELLDQLHPKIAAKGHSIEGLNLYVVEDDIGTPPLLPPRRIPALLGLLVLCETHRCGETAVSVRLGWQSG